MCPDNFLDGYAKKYGFDSMAAMKAAESAKQAEMARDLQAELLSLKAKKDADKAKIKEVVDILKDW